VHGLSRTALKAKQEKLSTFQIEHRKEKRMEPTEFTQTTVFEFLGHRCFESIRARFPHGWGHLSKFIILFSKEAEKVLEKKELKTKT
jgi:hypothetical protein